MITYAKKQQNQQLKRRTTWVAVVGCAGSYGVTRRLGVPHFVEVSSVKEWCVIVSVGSYSAGRF